MFERPEEVLATQPSLARDRRATQEDCRSIAQWIAHDLTADSRAYGGARWFGDGLLDVASARLSADALAQLAPALSSGRVRHFFACKNRLGPEGALALPQCVGTRSLWFGDNQCSLDGVVHVLEQCPDATELWLGRAAIGGDPHGRLVSALGASTTIRAVDLSGCELEADTIPAVAELARERAWTALFLDGNRVRPGLVASLSRVFASCTTLAMLRLNATALGDDGVEALCDGLRGARSLQALGVSSNGLSDRGAIAIAKLVSEHDALRAIEVGFVPVQHHSGAAPNELSERGLLAIIEAAKRHRALRSIEARGLILPVESQHRIIAAITEARSIDGLANESLSSGPHGDALRAALASNANHRRPAPHPIVRAILAPLHRWRSQFRTNVTAGSLVSNTVAPTLAIACSPAQIAAASTVIATVRAREELAPRSLTDEEQRLRAQARAWQRPHERRAQSHERNERRSEREEAQRARDQAKIAATGIRAGAARAERSATTLEQPQKCYVCRALFTALDAHYHRLCPSCAALNHEKKAQRAPLRGCLAVVTGARVHIGYRTTLSLLRCGCTVIATSRFVNEAWARFASEADFDEWRSRLDLRPLDLRFTSDVARFADSIAAEHSAVDVLVNNAAQTVARPPSYYAALRVQDERAAAQLPAGIPAVTALVAADTMEAALTESAASASVSDPRSSNSWRHEIDDVSIGELASAHAVNVLAPYTLIARLRSALVEAATRRGDAFVLNVSAIEGQFAQQRKPSRHPHTNMAKAALNMLTRTIADSFARERVLVCSVDPGWVSPQNPFAQDAAMRADGFAPPLDAEDGAARVLDPLFRKKNGERVEHGVLYKDFAIAPW